MTVKHIRDLTHGQIQVVVIDLRRDDLGLRALCTESGHKSIPPVNKDLLS